jgi:OmpA-OmpF porin, OOP family
MLRNLFVFTSAVALLLLGAPGPQTSLAQEEMCNPVLDSAREPVVASDGDIVAHGGTFVCPPAPAPVAEVTPPPVAEVAPAAPPPEPLPEGGVVFFAFDVAELDNEAQQTVSQIVQDIQDRDLGGITVAGHTDTAGPAEYNMQLSERRAQNVAAELIKHGIPARVIETEAYGQTQPAVETGDEVPLQANRRATIDFHPPT